MFVTFLLRKNKKIQAHETCLFDSKFTNNKYASIQSVSFKTMRRHEQLTPFTKESLEILYPSIIFDNRRNQLKYDIIKKFCASQFYFFFQTKKMNVSSVASNCLYLEESNQLRIIWHCQTKALLATLNNEHIFFTVTRVCHCCFDSQ